MQINRFGTFTLGVLFTAVSVGAVTYANAAGDATIKVCANKKTGAMRYLSKGSCKKTEKALQWNQTGPSGAAGPQVATTQSIHVVDASGKDFGVPLSADSSKATVFYDGGIWTLYNRPSLNIGTDGTANTSSNTLNDEGLFYDASCSLPFMSTDGLTNPVPQARGYVTFNGSRKYYKPTGSPFSGSSITSFYTNRFATCKSSSDASISGFIKEIKPSTTFYTNVTEVYPPSFLAPFTLVAK
jgi:hypothetical protein